MTTNAQPRLAARYFADNQDAKEETGRLELLASFYDPLTMRFFREEGLPISGQSILEFGFGIGSLFTAFREAVGESGLVLGIDKTPRIERHDAAEIRQGDIYEPDAAPGQYDIVHARLLLEHLDEPNRALANMIAACNPGGHVIIGDLDCQCVRARDEAHPAAHGFNAAVAEIRTAIATSGLMDPAFGCTLKERMVSAGLENVRERRFDRIVHGGSDWAVFQARNNLIIGEQVGASQAARTVARLMNEPGFAYHDQALVYAIGQAPHN